MSPSAAAGPGDLALLEWVGRLRLVPTDALAVAADLGGRTRGYARLHVLAAGGLVARVSLPLRPGRSCGLLHLTNRGVARLATARGADPKVLARAWRLRGTDLRALALRLPEHVGCCRLLAYLARSHDGPPELVAWERPTKVVYLRRRDERPTSVTFPARVELAWPEHRGVYLLLWDDEAVPVRAHRTRLVGLGRARNAELDAPPLVIGVGSAGRADSWRELLGEVADAAGGFPGVQVLAWDELPPLRGLGAGRRAHRGPEQLVLPLPPARRTRAVGAPFRPEPRSGSDARDVATRALALGPHDRTLLDAVGRHGFQTPAELAEVLAWACRAAATRCERLVRLGFAVRIARRDGWSDDRGGEIVLTCDGQRIASAWHGLTPAEGARYLGLTGRPPEGVGTRRRGSGQLHRELARNHTHTVQTNALVRGLVAAAGATCRPGERPLIEWRNASQCARGWLRPDAYVLLRHHGTADGYLVELDAASERADQLEAKLEAYCRYRDTEAYRRDYVGFPTILVVTTTYEALKEIAAILRASAVGRDPLPVLLTTRDLAAADPDGYGGEVWYEPVVGEEWPWKRRRLWSGGITSLPAPLLAPGAAR